jgi:membrane fusion protein (multidrug efflux system)
MLPNTSPTKPVLSTAAYAKQLDDADALIERVIRENRPRGHG